MKKLLFAATLCLALCIAGCNAGSSGNPSEVLSSFFDAMAKKDMAKVKDLATPDSQSMLSLMEMGMKNAGKEMDKFDKTKVEFGTAIIDGDNAKVPVKDKAKGEVVNFPMKKIAGKWKVAFDKTSMMGMATDKMKDGGINMTDSINKAMDAIKGMNTDSLKEAIENIKGVNMDSLKNEMKKAIDQAK